VLPAAGVTGTSTDVAVVETGIGIEIAATTETGGGRKPAVLYIVSVPNNNGGLQ